MRNLVIGIMLVWFTFLSVFIWYTVYGRLARQAELENGCNLALEGTMKLMLEEEGLRPQNNEEMIAAFYELLLPQIKASGEITVHILAVDYEKGLLRVAVEEQYRHIGGRLGRILVEKTILLEQYEEEEIS